MAEIEGAWPGGIHFEYTGRDVTECLGEPSVAVLEEHSRTATRRCATCASTRASRSISRFASPSWWGLP